MKLLHIEDDPLVAQAIEGALRSGSPFRQFERAVSLAEGLERLATSHYDLVLLDLGLPDSRGIDTVRSFLANADGTPVVVLTQDDADGIGRAAVALGAQDFLTKASIDAESIRSALRKAIDRRRVQRKLQEIRQSEIQTRAGQPSRMMPLRESMPESYWAIIQRYTELLESVVEQRVSELPFDISAAARDIAGAVGFLNGGARDVIDIHVTALRKRTAEMEKERAHVFEVEGRVLLIEIMGYLSDHYRNAYLDTDPVA